MALDDGICAITNASHVIFSKAVFLNAAPGLIVSENQKNFSEAYSITRQHILSGKTYEHLKKLQF